MESKLLRVVDFKLDLDQAIPNKKTNEMLIKTLYEKHQWQIMWLAVRSIANDSFYTYVNLTYSTQTVGFACVLLGAQRSE